MLETDVELLNDLDVMGDGETLIFSGIVDGFGGVRLNRPANSITRFTGGLKAYDGASTLLSGTLELTGGEHKAFGALALDSSLARYVIQPGGALQLNSGVSGGTPTNQGVLRINGGALQMMAGSSIGTPGMADVRVELNSGTILGSHNYPIHAEWRWRGGSWIGGAATLATLHGPLVLESNMVKTLQRWVETATTNAVVTWSDGNIAANTNGIIFHNAPAAFTAAGDNSFNGGALLIGPAASFVKDGAFGVTAINGFFGNEGAVEVKTGTLRITGGDNGPHTGTFSVFPSAALEFRLTNHTLGLGSSIAIQPAAKLTVMQDATLSLAGLAPQINLQGTALVQTATLAGGPFAEVMMSGGRLHLEGGTLGGIPADLLTLSGNGDIVVENFGFAVNHLRRSVLSGLLINTIFTNTVLTFHSNAAWTANGPLFLFSSDLEAVTNHATITLGGSGSLISLSGANRVTPYLNAQGLVLAAQNSTLRLAGGGQLQANMNVPIGALILEAGDFDIDLDITAPALSLNNGTFRIESNALFRLTRTFSPASFTIGSGVGANSAQLAGGEIRTGPVPLLVQPPFQWTGGTLGGNSLVVFSSNVTLSGPNLKRITNSSVVFTRFFDVRHTNLVMDGSAGLASFGGSLILSNGVRIVGGATNGVFTDTGPHAFDGVPNPVGVDVPFVNAGTLLLEGDVELSRQSTFAPSGIDRHTGAFHSHDGSRLVLSGGTQLFDGVTWIPGPSWHGATSAPLIRLDGADMRVNGFFGNYLTDIEFASGSFGGFFTNVTDDVPVYVRQFTWSGGTFLGHPFPAACVSEITAASPLNVIRIQGSDPKSVQGRKVFFETPAMWEGTGTVSLASAGSSDAILRFLSLMVAGDATVDGNAAQLMLVQGNLTVATNARLKALAPYMQLLLGGSIQLQRDALLELHGGGELKNLNWSVQSNALALFKAGIYDIENCTINGFNTHLHAVQVDGATLRMADGAPLQALSPTDFRLAEGAMLGLGASAYNMRRLTWSGGAFGPNGSFHPTFDWSGSLFAELDGTNKTLSFAILSLPFSTWSGGDLYLNGSLTRPAQLNFTSGLNSTGNVRIVSATTNFTTLTVFGNWTHQGGALSIESGHQLSSVNFTIQSNALARVLAEGFAGGSSFFLSRGHYRIETNVLSDTTLSMLVTSSGRFSGNGFFDGSVNVQGVIGPGLAPDRLQIGGALQIESGGVYEWHLGDWQGAPGTGYNHIRVDHVATIQNGSAVRIRVDDMTNFTGEDTEFLILTADAGIVINTNLVFVDKSQAGPASGGRWDLVVQGGTNLLLAYSKDPYLLWVASNGLTGADAAFLADPDNDDLPNGIEFIFGGIPTNNVPFAPSLTLGFQNLFGTNYLYASYPQWEFSAYLNPTFQVADTVDGVYTSVAPGVDGVLQNVASNAFGIGIAHVEIWVPATNTPTRFGRFRVAR